MPLEVTDFWAVKKDVLPGASLGFLLFDLDFQDLVGMLDDL